MFTLNELKNIEKPSRYLGGESGEIIKSKRNNLRVAVVLPDIYENAIINETMNSIYNELNSLQGIWCERVFSPKADFENLIRLNDSKIYTLESKTSIDTMNILIFVIDDEMQYTNTLNILNLGKIPILNSRRDASHPIIIFVGDAVLNTKVLQDFCNLFVIGETANVIGNICKEYIKHFNCKNAKDNFIKSLVKTEGIYISRSNCKVNYLKSKQFKYTSYGNHITPSMLTKFNTNLVKITRGCDVECKICKERYIYGTTQNKQNIMYEIKEKQKQTGEKDITLLTNCVTDSEAIKEVIYNLTKDSEFKNSKINIYDIKLNKKNLWILRYLPKDYLPTIFVGGVSKNSKEILGINETKQDIEYIAKQVFKLGFAKLKLIYIIGVPKENYEELSQILTTAENVVNIYLEEYPNNVATNIVDIELLNFAPMAYTLIERTEANTPDKLELKSRYVINKNNNPYIAIKAELPYKSCIKTILSRGDEKLSNVIYDAWKNGARFDNDSKLFNEEAWKIAIQKNKINIKDYLNEINESIKLRWDNVVINKD